MNNAQTYKEVNATAKESAALKGIMMVELLKMKNAGYSKEVAMDMIKSRRHELSQMAFKMGAII